MSLSKEEVMSHGVLVENLGPTDADPDVDEVIGELTIDGHTIHFNGRSQEAVLESIESALKAKGRIERGDEGDVAEAESQGDTVRRRDAGGRGG